MDSTFHTNEVRRRCRICGEVIPRSASGRPVSSNAGLLDEAFGVNVLEDTSGMHPTRMCMKCAATSRSLVHVEPTVSGIKRQTSLTAFDWRAHHDSCPLCDEWRRQQTSTAPSRSRGAPRGRGTKRGRPGQSQEEVEGEEVKSDPSVEAGEGLDVTCTGEGTSEDVACTGEGTSEDVTCTGEETSEELTSPPAVRICPDNSCLKSYKADKSLDTDSLFVSELTDALICPICKDVVDAPVASPRPEGVSMHAVLPAGIHGSRWSASALAAEGELRRKSFIRYHAIYALCSQGCFSTANTGNEAAPLSWSSKTSSGRTSTSVFENRPLLPEHIYRKALGKDPPAGWRPGQPRTWFRHQWISHLARRNTEFWVCCSNGWRRKRTQPLVFRFTPVARPCISPSHPKRRPEVGQCPARQRSEGTTSYRWCRRPSPANHSPINWRNSHLPSLKRARRSETDCSSMPTTCQPTTSYHWHSTCACPKSRLASSVYGQSSGKFTLPQKANVAAKLRKH